MNIISKKCIKDGVEVFLVIQMHKVKKINISS